MNSSCEISPLEIREYPFIPYSQEQVILHFVKIKGGPIKGHIYLEIEDGYKWESLKLPCGTHLISWEKIN